MQPTVLRDDPPPGEEAQVDYGYLGLWTDPLTERRRRLWAFTIVLSHSRHMFVGVVHKMDQQAWLQCHVDAFGFFGGAPAILVIDNLKTGVLKLCDVVDQTSMSPRSTGATRSWPPTTTS
jgi:transposase